ncbi:hypothetical protein BCR37DRAFT_395659 [Protomyces lactucae-debilis]|uniref:Rrp15p-domain-containing protein n=1 Tax=Protomyces lactucae-debilis TaxID=2754530 RepID=A0A1Y2EUG7_PROLT|nr:uncharacterized protein BCR37DRAFT_395659 [Protomyces lactucae-debilis]ORY74806.1 hypothetical protein BCR37DRAFT_395659 [Protomyces lactucae-debilis]
MQPASKKQRVMQAADQSQLRPDQVKATSNIFGELKEDESESESEEDEEEEDEQDNHDDEEEEDEDEDDDHEGEPSKKRKKNDPEAFATAMQKILGAGLTQQNRKNPILARSIESKKLDLAAADAKLDIKARKQIAQERKAALDKNHKEQPNAAESEQAAARVIEKERALRKVAQRGVVRLGDRNGW